MLALLNHTVALTIALGYLLLMLFAPFLLAWFLWRIASDLRRIADAAQDTKLAYMDAHEIDGQDCSVRARNMERRISNSMFGR